MFLKLLRAQLLAVSLEIILLKCFFSAISVSYTRILLSGWFQPYFYYFFHPKEQVQPSLKRFCRILVTMSELSCCAVFYKPAFSSKRGFLKELWPGYPLLRRAIGVEILSSMPSVWKKWQNVYHSFPWHLFWLSIRLIFAISKNVGERNRICRVLQSCL